MPGLVSARRRVPHRGAGSIPVHSICYYAFTSFVFFVGLELDLGLWMIFLYQKERGREGGRERERERERVRQTDKQTDRETDRQADRKKEQGQRGQER